MESTTPHVPEQASRRARGRSGALRRSTRDRVLTGVAGGIGERIGVDPTVVRLCFVALSLAAGIGGVVYLAAWLASVPGTAATSAPQPTSARQALALGFIVLGVLVMLRQTGLWLGDRFVWPAVLVAAGSAVIWTRGDEADRARWSRAVRRLPAGWQRAVTGSGIRVHVAGGMLLIVGGLWRFLTTARRAPGLSTSAPVAVAATLVSLAVVAGPWFWRLGRQLTEERRQRIRSQERAEVAAHLHDSVLQTLALIQRTDEPRQMASLARSQERELRAWLYGGARAADPTLLSTAMNDTAAEIERAYSVRIDVVTVGERRIDEPTGGLVLAAREAMINAAAHSGAERVAVYVETTQDQVTAYVRDQGHGFDPTDVPADRRGIADSIEGRMTRLGGVAALSTAPGRGTEVKLQVSVT